MSAPPTNTKVKATENVVAIATEQSSASSSSAPKRVPKAKQNGTIATCARCGVIGHRTTRCISHLLPDVIVALVASKKHRMEQVCRRWKQEWEEAGGAGATAASAASESSSAASSTTPTTSPSSTSSVDLTHLSGYCPSQHYHIGTNLTILPSERESELLFLGSPNPSALAQGFCSMELLNRHFEALYMAQWDAGTIEGVVEKVKEVVGKMEKERDTVAASASSSSSSAAVTSAASSTPSTPIVLRLQCYPKTIRQSFLDALSPSVSVHPKSNTHILFLVHSYNKYFFGIEDKTNFVMPIHQRRDQVETREMKDEILSRAYHKMSESFLIDEALRKRITTGSRAMDIGASPGGWSAFLASLGCHVLAVDPGVVHCSSPLVQHVPKLIENATEEIAQFVSSHKLDLIVCDMNVRPEEACNLIKSVCETNKSALSDTCMLVLTCKETQAGRSKKLVQDAMISLSDYFHNFRSYHLLSNGKERTLIGDYLLISEAERNVIREERAKNEAARLEAWEKKCQEKDEEQKRKEAEGLKKEKKVKEPAAEESEEKSEEKQNGKKQKQAKQKGAAPSAAAEQAASATVVQDK